MVTNDTRLLRIVHFADMTRWSAHCSAFGNVKSRFPLVPLSAILKRIKEPIFIEDGVLYRRITVRNNGRGVVQRDELYGSEIGTKRQFVAHAGQFIISRIDARNGAFGIVPSELDGAVVTNDFWLFEVQTAIPEYLMLVLSSGRFQQYWQTQSSGTTNRQRVSENDFLDSKISLPSINTQLLLVSRYNKALEVAQMNILKARRLESGIDDLLLMRLNITVQETRNSDDRRISFYRFSECDRWSVDYLLNKNSCKFIETSTYPIVRVKDIISSYQYGLSEKATEDATGTPILRMNNIRNSSIDISNLKYLSNCTNSIDKYILNNGDLLFNRTNSKELVGKTAVFSLPGRYVFASYLIRIVINANIADVKYVNYLFATKVIRSQIDLLSRQILGQANINVAELKSLKLPLPPLDVQRDIVIEIDEIIQDLNTCRRKADELKKSAVLEFEEAIFDEA